MTIASSLQSRIRTRSYSIVRYRRVKKLIRAIQGAICNPVSALPLFDPLKLNVATVSPRQNALFRRRSVLGLQKAARAFSVICTAKSEINSCQAGTVEEKIGRCCEILSHVWRGRKRLAKVRNRTPTPLNFVSAPDGLGVMRNNLLEALAPFCVLPVRAGGLSSQQCRTDQRQSKPFGHFIPQPLVAQPQPSCWFGRPAMPAAPGVRS